MTHSLADLMRGFAGARMIVVGGRGGVGAAVVQQASDLGARVIAASRSGEGDWLAPANGQSVHALLDLANPASIGTFAARTAEQFGAIDILVITAGQTRSVALADLAALDDALIDLVFESNVIGPLRLARDLAPLLRAGRDPVIVNVSSVAARTGQGSNIAYGAAKAAMNTVMVSLAKALAPEVRTVSIAPSALDTPFAAGRGPDFIERTIAATPLARLATVEEVANAVLAAARLLTATTGGIVHVDGGRHL